VNRIIIRSEEITTFPFFGRFFEKNNFFQPTPQKLSQTCLFRPKKRAKRAKRVNFEATKKNSREKKESGGGFTDDDVVFFGRSITRE